MTEQEVWDLVLGHEQQLRSLCRRAGRTTELLGSSEDWGEELYHRAVLGRAHQIMRTYDPTKGTSPFTHLYGAVKWYLLKEIRAQAQQQGRERLVEPVYEEHLPSRATDGEAAESNEYLERIRSELGPAYADVFWWIAGMEFTRQEVADYMKVPLREVRSMYVEALRCVRRDGGP